MDGLKEQCVNRKLKATQGRILIGSMQRQSEFASIFVENMESCFSEVTLSEAS